MTTPACGPHEQKLPYGFAPYQRAPTGEAGMSRLDEIRKHGVSSDHPITDDVKYLLALVDQLGGALEKVDRANWHSGPGPHCTCSQAERQSIIGAALKAYKEE